MIHKSIQYWETFPVDNGGWVKMVDEILLEPGESPRDAFYEAKKTVQNTFYEMKGHDKKVATEQKEQSLDENGVAIAEILLCKTIKDLETYKLRASQNTSVQTAYNQKLNELIIKKTKKLP